MKKTALRDAAILFGLVAVGAVLRAPYLVAGLWRDEASTYFEVVPNGFFAVAAAVTRGELNPPGYFLLERLWTALAGSSALVLKLPSFVCGILLIVATYWLARSFWSQSVAWVAAAFATVTPAALDLSAEARPYSLAALLAAVTLWYYLRASRAERPAGALVGFVVSGIALAYVHYTGLVLLGWLAIATPYVLWRGRRLKRLTPFGAAFAAIGILYVPWFGALRTHLATGTPWTEPLPRSQIVGAIQGNVTAMLPLISAHSTIWLALIVGLAVAAVVVAIRCTRGDVTALPSAPTFAVGLAVVGGAAVGAFLSQREPRYVYVYAPAAWIWFAALLTSVVRQTMMLRRIPLRVTVGAVLALAFGLLAGGELRARVRAPRVIVSSGIWRFVPEALGLARGGRTLFLAVPDYLGPTLGYYVGVPAKQPIHGFARWDQPELFTPQGYPELWDEPRGLGDAEGKIMAATRSGTRLIVLVRDHDIADRGQMQYARAWGLIAWLRATFPRAQSLRLAGRKESVDVDVYAVPRSGPAR